MLPDIPAKAFSLSAVAVGYLLIDDLTANEQNAIGNWLKLVSQVLCTNAFYKQVQQERHGGGTRESNSYPNYNVGLEDEDSIVMLQKMVAALSLEIENLKNQR